MYNTGILYVANLLNKFFFNDLFFRRQLLIVIALFSYEFLCGINHLFFYSDFIFEQAGIPTEYVTIATIGALAIKLIGALSAVSKILMYIAII